ncbi:MULTISPECIES: hypothetical protein [unclassified Microcoleus]|uniref:hypothetical protein n=1 Tax=unclassified Microcoleus TaxID=2642155 RepID=UPI0025EEC70D|nr:MULTISPECIES: hypothetical protein [unclassified Microcoleus]
MGSSNNKEEGRGRREKNQSNYILTFFLIILDSHRGTGTEQRGLMDENTLVAASRNSKKTKVMRPCPCDRQRL